MSDKKINEIIVTEDPLASVKQVSEKIMEFGPTFPDEPQDRFVFTLTSKPNNPTYIFSEESNTWQSFGLNTYTEKAEIQSSHSITLLVKDLITNLGVGDAWVYIKGPHHSTFRGTMKYTRKLGNVTFSFVPALTTNNEDLNAGGHIFDIMVGKKGYQEYQGNIVTDEQNITSGIIDLNPGNETPNLLVMTWIDRSDEDYAINHQQYKIDKTEIEKYAYNYCVIQPEPLGKYTGSDLCRRSITYASEGFPDNFEYKFLFHRFDSTGTFANNDFLYWNSQGSLDGMAYDPNLRYDVGSTTYYDYKYYEAITDNLIVGPANAELWSEEPISLFDSDELYEVRDIVYLESALGREYFRAIRAGKLPNPENLNGFEFWSRLYVYDYQNRDIVKGTMVYYDGAVFTARKDITGNAPGTVGWMLVDLVYNYGDTYLKEAICIFQKVWYEAKFDIYSRAPGRSDFWLMPEVKEPYSSITTYQPGQFVRFGMGIYRARRITQNNDCLNYYFFFPVYLERGKEYSNQATYQRGDVAVVNGIYFIAKVEIEQQEFDMDQWIRVQTSDEDNDFDFNKKYNVGDEVISCGATEDIQIPIKYYALRDSIGQEPAISPDDWEEVGSVGVYTRNTYLFNPRETYEIDDLIVHEHIFYTSDMKRTEMRPYTARVKTVNSTPYVNDSFWKLIENYDWSRDYPENGISVTSVNQADVNSGLCFKAKLPIPGNFVTNTKYWERFTTNYDNRNNYSAETFLTYGPSRVLPSPNNVDKAWETVTFNELDLNRRYELGEEFIYNGKLYECIQYGALGSYLQFNSTGSEMLAIDGNFYFAESSKLKTADWTTIGDYRKLVNAEGEITYQRFIDSPTIINLEPTNTSFWSPMYVTSSQERSLSYYEDYRTDRNYTKNVGYFRVRYNDKFYELNTSTSVFGIPLSNATFWREWVEFSDIDHYYRLVHGAYYRNEANSTCYDYSKCIFPNFIQNILPTDDRYWLNLKIPEYNRSVTYTSTDRVKHRNTNGIFEVFENIYGLFTGIPPESEVHWQKLDDVLEYDSERQYVAGNKVQFNSLFYEVIDDFIAPYGNFPVTKNSYWQKIGIDGIQIEEFVANKTYFVGDSVFVIDDTTGNKNYYVAKGTPEQFVDTDDQNWQEIINMYYYSSYVTGNIVRYNSVIYRTIANSTSGYPDDYNKDGISYAKHFYQTTELAVPGKIYKVGSLVEGADGKVYCLWPKISSNTNPNGDSINWQLTGTVFEATRGYYDTGEICEFEGEFYRQPEQRKIYRNVSPNGQYYWQSYDEITTYNETTIYEKNAVVRDVISRKPYKLTFPHNGVRDVSPDNEFFWHEVYTEHKTPYRNNREYRIRDSVTYDDVIYVCHSTPVIISHHYDRNGYWGRVPDYDKGSDYALGSSVRSGGVIFTATSNIESVFAGEHTDNQFWQTAPIDVTYRPWKTYNAGDNGAENGWGSDNRYYTAQVDIENRYITNTELWQPLQENKYYEIIKNFDVGDFVVNWDGDTTYYTPKEPIISNYPEQNNPSRDLFWEVVSVTSYRYSYNYSIHQYAYSGNRVFKAKEAIQRNDLSSSFWTLLGIYNNRTSYPQYRSENESLNTQVSIEYNSSKYCEPLEEIYSQHIYDASTTNASVTPTEQLCWFEHYVPRYRVYNSYAPGTIVNRRTASDLGYFYKAKTNLVAQWPRNENLWERILPFIQFQSYSAGDRVLWYNDSNRYYVAKINIPDTSPNNLYNSVSNPLGYWLMISQYDRNKQYNTSDYVVYGNVPYKALKPSKNVYPPDDITAWQNLGSIIQNYSCVVNKQFNVNDIVRVNSWEAGVMNAAGYDYSWMDPNILYLAIRNIDNVTPKTTNPEYWQELTNFVDWNAESDYLAGEVVRGTNWNTSSWSDYYGDDIPIHYYYIYEYSFFYIAKSNIVSNNIIYNDAEYVGSHQTFWTRIDKILNYNYDNDYSENDIVDDLQNQHYTNTGHRYYTALRNIVSNSIIYRTIDYSGSHKVFWTTKLASGNYNEVNDYNQYIVVHGSSRYNYRAEQDIVSNHLDYNDIDHTGDHKVFWEYAGPYVGYSYDNDYPAGVFVARDQWLKSKVDIISNALKWNDTDNPPLEDNTHHKNFWIKGTVQVYDFKKDWNQGDVVSIDQYGYYMDGYYTDTWWSPYDADRDWYNAHNGKFIMAKTDVESNGLDRVDYWQINHALNYDFNNDYLSGEYIFNYHDDYWYGGYFKEAKIDIIANGIYYSNLLPPTNIHPRFWQTTDVTDIFNYDDDHWVGDLVRTSPGSHDIIMCKKSYVSNSINHYVGSLSNIAGHRAFWERKTATPYSFYSNQQHQDIGNNDVGSFRNDVVVYNGQNYRSKVLNPIRNLSVRKYWKWNPLLGAVDIYMAAADSMFSNYPETLPAILGLLVDDTGSLTSFDVFQTNIDFDGASFWITHNILGNSPESVDVDKLGNPIYKTYLRHYDEQYPQLIQEFNITGSEIYYTDRALIIELGYGKLNEIIYKANPNNVSVISKSNNLAIVNLAHVIENDVQLSTANLAIDISSWAEIAPFINDISDGETEFKLFCHYQLSGYDRIWKGAGKNGKSAIELSYAEDELWTLKITAETIEEPFICKKSMGTNDSAPWLSGTWEPSANITVVEQNPYTLNDVTDGFQYVYLNDINGQRYNLRHLLSTTSYTNTHLTEFMMAVSKKYENIGYIYPYKDANKLWLKYSKEFIEKFR